MPQTQKQMICIVRCCGKQIFFISFWAKGNSSDADCWLSLQDRLCKFHCYVALGPPHPVIRNKFKLQLKSLKILLTSL